MDQETRYVAVAPLAPVDAVYTYAVPADLVGRAVPGARALVPFGTRSLTGVIVGVGDPPSGSESRDLVDVLDEDMPAVTAEILDLTRWLSDYYVCSWGEALRAALPPGFDIASRRVVRATGFGGESLSESERAVVEVLAGRPRGAARGELDRLVGSSVTAALLRRLVDAGAVVVEDEVAPPRVKARTRRHLRLVGPASDALSAVRGPKQAALVETLGLAAAATMDQAAALKASGASSAAVRALVDKGLLEIVEVAVERGAESDVTAPAHPIALHPGQTNALEAIDAALAAGDASTFLLHGVTGSGKTEVYIRAVMACQARGRTAVILVPEIALTPQTVRRFRAHFGDQVAVLHSRMSDGERLDAWSALRSGRKSVAVGPRSAVFAPLDHLGLVVVDEEHEGSYKQFEPAPRYHARDVAVWRAHRAGAVCVLGSATPSLESLANARADKYTLLPMAERVPIRGERPASLPTVRVVDLTRERRMRRLQGALSDELRDAIGVRLDRSEQVILLQNRRGYAPVLTCEACGATPQCRNCAVSMTVHKAGRNLRCHYCGRAERLPTRCAECGSDALEFLGAGTQRVEEEIAEIMPEARVLRMDLDTTAGRGSHKTILDRFGRGEADILLGTQMVAKGLDFPRVTLVGIVNADTGLLLPDFRASERTFQLLSQVAGRAGRADLEGEVILQTRNPDHPAVDFAAQHDYVGFAAHELGERHALGYPPFGRLVGIEFKGPDDAGVRDLASAWVGALRGEIEGVAGVEVLGPTQAFIGRVKRQFRHHALVKAVRAVPASRLADLVRSANARTRAPARYRVNVDVDPVGLF